MKRCVALGVIDPDCALESAIIADKQMKNHKKIYTFIFKWLNMIIFMPSYLNLQ